MSGGEHQRVIDGGVGCDGGAELSGGDNLRRSGEMPVAVADPSVSTPFPFKSVEPPHEPDQVSVFAL